MRFTARVALPRPDEGRALAVLRGELRDQAAAHWRVPDWGTLEIDGPVEVVGASGRAWYRWAAAVEAQELSARRPPA
ncbi:MULTISPECIES: hypothetical protein [unclassified Blastococcus]